MSRFAFLVLALTLALPCMTSPLTNSIVMAQEEAAEPINDSVGYLVGYSMGRDIVRSGFQAGDFTSDGLLAGIMDALNQKDPALGQEALIEAQGKIQGMLQKREAEMMAEQRKAAVMNKEKSELYLEQNAKVEGVQTLEGGLQYKVLQEGKGPSPGPQDTVTAHYTGKLIDGTVFDSSVARGEPFTFQVGGVIPGWQTAIQQMNVGSKWMLFIPPSMGYGEDGSPPKIGPNETLVFEIELLDIK